MGLSGKLLRLLASIEPVRSKTSPLVQTSVISLSNEKARPWPLFRDIPSGLVQMAADKRASFLKEVSGEAKSCILELAADCFKRSVLSFEVLTSLLESTRS